MYLKRFCLFTAILTGAIKAAVIPAFGDDQLPYDFPIYGVDAACNAVFASQPDDERHSNVSACLDREQKANDLLKSIWKDATAKNKDACEAESRGLYSTLYACMSKRQKQDKLPLQLVPKLHPASQSSNLLWRGVFLDP